MTMVAGVVSVDRRSTGVRHNDTGGRRTSCSLPLFELQTPVILGVTGVVWIPPASPKSTTRSGAAPCFPSIAYTARATADAPKPHCTTVARMVAAPRRRCTTRYAALRSTASGHTMTTRSECMP